MSNFALPLLGNRINKATSIWILFAIVIVALLSKLSLSIYYEQKFSISFVCFFQFEIVCFPKFNSSQIFFTGCPYLYEIAHLVFFQRNYYPFPLGCHYIALKTKFQTQAVLYQIATFNPYRWILL